MLTSGKYRSAFVAKTNWGNIFGMVLVGAVGIAFLNEVANNPKVSPLWRKVARTAEGDLYQHIITDAFVTIGV